MPWKILPVEMITFAGFLVCLLLKYFFGLEWYGLNKASFSFAYSHYLGPLVPIFVLSVIGSFTGGAIARKDQAINFVFLTRMGVALSAAVLLHFNLKIWAPLINRNNYDALYWALDQNLSWLLNGINAIHQWVPQKLPLMANPYHDLFVLMFTVSFTLHGLRGRESAERVMTATVLVLLAGAVCYSLAPAIGPFVFEPQARPDLAHVQGLMHRFLAAFVQSNGSYYEPGLFMAMPAAMPSLHIANAAVFFLFALREFRWLAWIYGPLIIYFAIEAVGLNWHYMIDIPVGFLVGWLAYRVAIRYCNHSSRLIHDAGLTMTSRG